MLPPARFVVSLVLSTKTFTYLPLLPPSFFLELGLFLLVLQPSINDADPGENPRGLRSLNSRYRQDKWRGSPHPPGHHIVCSASTVRLIYFTAHVVFLHQQFNIVGERGSCRRRYSTCRMLLILGKVSGSYINKLHPILSSQAICSLADTRKLSQAGLGFFFLHLI